MAQEKEGNLKALIDILPDLRAHEIIESDDQEIIIHLIKNRHPDILDAWKNFVDSVESESSPNNNDHTNNNNPKTNVINDSESQWWRLCQVLLIAARGYAKTRMHSYATQAAAYIERRLSKQQLLYEDVVYLRSLLPPAQSDTANFQFGDPVLLAAFAAYNDINFNLKNLNENENSSGSGGSSSGSAGDIFAAASSNNANELYDTVVRIGQRYRRQRAPIKNLTSESEAARILLLEEIKNSARNFRDDGIFRRPQSSPDRLDQNITINAPKPQPPNNSNPDLTNKKDVPNINRHIVVPLLRPFQTRSNYLRELEKNNFLLHSEREILENILENDLTPNFIFRSVIEAAFQSLHEIIVSPYSNETDKSSASLEFIDTLFRILQKNIHSEQKALIDIAQYCLDDFFQRSQNGDDNDNNNRIRLADYFFVNSCIDYIRQSQTPSFASNDQFNSVLNKKLNNEETKPENKSDNGLNDSFFPSSESIQDISSINHIYPLYDCSLALFAAVRLYLTYFQSNKIDNDDGSLSSVNLSEPLTESQLSAREELDDTIARIATEWRYYCPRLSQEILLFLNSLNAHHTPTNDLTFNKSLSHVFLSSELELLEVCVYEQCPSLHASCLQYKESQTLAEWSELQDTLFRLIAREESRRLFTPLQDQAKIILLKLIDASENETEVGNKLLSQADSQHLSFLLAVSDPTLLAIVSLYNSGAANEQETIDSLQRLGASWHTTAEPDVQALLSLLERLVAENAISEAVAYTLELLLYEQNPVLLSAFYLYDEARTRSAWIDFHNTLTHLYRSRCLENLEGEMLTHEEQLRTLIETASSTGYVNGHRVQPPLTSTGRKALLNLANQSHPILEAAFYDLLHSENTPEFINTLVLLSRAWEKEHPLKETLLAHIHQLYQMEHNSCPPANLALTHGELDVLLHSIYVDDPAPQAAWNIWETSDGSLQDWGELHDSLRRICERNFRLLVSKHTLAAHSFLRELKTKLGTSVSEAGIEYLHSLVDAGDPVLFAAFVENNANAGKPDLLELTDTLLLLSTRWQRGLKRKVGQDNQYSDLDDFDDSSEYYYLDYEGGDSEAAFVSPHSNIISCISYLAKHGVLSTTQVERCEWLTWIEEPSFIEAYYVYETEACFTRDSFAELLDTWFRCLEKHERQNLHLKKQDALLVIKALWKRQEQHNRSKDQLKHDDDFFESDGSVILSNGSKFYPPLLSSTQVTVGDWSGYFELTPSDIERLYSCVIHEDVALLSSVTDFDNSHPAASDELTDTFLRILNFQISASYEEQSDGAPMRELRKILNYLRPFMQEENIWHAAETAWALQDPVLYAAFYVYKAARLTEGNDKDLINGPNNNSSHSSTAWIEFLETISKLFQAKAYSNSKFKSDEFISNRSLSDDSESSSSNINSGPGVDLGTSLPLNILLESRIRALISANMLTPHQGYLLSHCLAKKDSVPNEILQALALFSITMDNAPLNHVITQLALRLQSNH